MLLDWFTVFAQILNFFVLLALLKVFLYGPITNAMQERRQGVADEMAKARKSRAEAESLTARLREEREELENKTSEVMAEIRVDAEKWQKQEMELARGEIEGLRREWLAALAREKAAVASYLRNRLVHEVANTAALMVRDLADSELEELVMSGFLRNISSEAREVDCGDSEILIRTGFEQSEVQKRKLAGILSELFPVQNERIFIHDADLGFGIELIAGDRKWEWNLSSYVTELEHKILQEIKD